MKRLLDKTRRLNKTLQNAGSEPLSFLELSKKLSEILDANVYIVNRKGRVLGYQLSEVIEGDKIQIEVEENNYLPKNYNDEILTITESKENLKNFDKTIFGEEVRNDNERNSTIIPIISGGERLGTLILARFEKDFLEEDLILAEYSATIVGMEILKSKSEEVELESRKKSIVQMAIGTLSYSELEAMHHIFHELDGDEGLLVASKIADKVGITRSVIVNALRKFESAGIIESRSLGMKGTHIKILNDKLIGELEKATN